MLDIKALVTIGNKSSEKYCRKLQPKNSITASQQYNQTRLTLYPDASILKIFF